MRCPCPRKSTASWRNSVTETGRRAADGNQRHVTAIHASVACALAKTLGPREDRVILAVPYRTSRHLPLPVLPWPGGKRRLIKYLCPHFPIHDTYVDAFAGGAAALLMRPVPAKLEVLNDINSDPVTLYRCVTHHLEESVRMFRWSLMSPQMFEWATMDGRPIHAVWRDHHQELARTSGKPSVMRPPLNGSRYRRSKLRGTN
ncbi:MULTISPECIES: DNA adenine methylase [Stenotrophomonas]|uniref:DNA adenine methylase n=1 Tax=Stenotrophomonas sp. CFBP8994 TaxID=3096527 RepID=UPI002A6AD801|nr:DNA adenine methylase [Stenotrophomonas sp. CFBP8994]MDY0982068.1 DNA adenine methylase [Stenotrophomonas sp. CFBP8994]